MSEPATCPCEGLDHPREIRNQAGRSSLDYRVGEFWDFREALLAALPGETQLKRWRPGAEGDLAVQLVEWWAYLADVLTFYSERIANQSYLLTADQPESVARLIRILGYRPRPGIGAVGTLAGLLSGPNPVTLPAGFQVQSKPGPGKAPQTFELDSEVTLQPPDAVAADPAGDGVLLTSSGGTESVLLAGVVTAVRPRDEVLLLGSADSAYVAVASVVQERDPHGRPNTRVTFAGATGLSSGALAGDYRLLKGALVAHLWPYTADSGVVASASQVDLDGIARQAKAGEWVVLRDRTQDTSTALFQETASVSQYEELVWYANGKSSDPSQPDPNLASNQYPIPIPHSRLTFAQDLTKSWDGRKAVAEVRYGFREVGRLVGTPPSSLELGPDLTATIVAAGAAAFATGTNQPLLLEDARGHGLQLEGDSADGATMTLGEQPSSQTSLRAPLRALFGLFPVSRGTTVKREVLGSGDATRPFQEFTLQKSPVTYLSAPASSSGPDYRSSVRVWVDGIEWREAPSFYGQAPDARVFVSREDEQAKTHLLFGDGINGARLPSGSGNVVASYRYGSGADSPAAGTLTVVSKPQPGLKAVRNPVAVSGGADPDPAAKIKQLGPRSVLAFGRAVSADDFQVIAAQAPGVRRARSYYAWDAESRRGLVKVYVGDDDAAVTSARTALTGAADPNRRFVVAAAKPRELELSLTVEVASDRVPDEVRAAVEAALTDDDSGLLGLARSGIGKRLYESEVYAACLAVPGVVAVRQLSVSQLLEFTWQGNEFAIWWPMFGGHADPGEGGYFQADVSVSAEVSAYDL